MQTQSLESALRASAITPFHIARIREIDNTDFSGVLRKVREDLAQLGFAADDDYLSRGLLALKQYYAVAVLDPLNMHAVSDTLDPFWHAHILHTQQYEEFCGRVVGGFMHHVPLDHDRSLDVRAVDRLYSYTGGCLSEFFLEVDPEFFPAELPDARLICFHGNRYEAPLLENALKPRNPEMVLEHLAA